VSKNIKHIPNTSELYSLIMVSSFLLVSLTIDAVLSVPTLRGRRKTLDEITKGDSLGDAYAETLSRVQAQPRSRSKLGMQVLMWLSHSERPLRVDELRHALGVEEGSGDLNIRNIPEIERLLECSLGLVTVDESSSTVHLVHYTVQDCLSRDQNLFLNPHSTIAETCLTYLNSTQVRAISPALRSVPQSLAFVEYVSCYWGTHARWETTESVKALALKLLDGYNKHISSKVLFFCEMRALGQPFGQDDTSVGFTGLHGAAYFGCVEIAAALLEMSKCDVQATDFRGNTAIAWAARRGNVEVLRILLEQSDVNPDTADTQYCRTPLSWAAKSGHEGVVRIFLGRGDVNPNKADKKGRTPLSQAAGSGHEGVMRVLLEQGEVNPDKADKKGRTPLSRAAGSGHEGVVRMLLERDSVNPEKVDAQYGRTPLSWAAENGCEGVVRLLLERDDVDPNTADIRYGQTPLSWAAEGGHEGVVRMLLERDDVYPDKTDKKGRTPLWWAARRGHKWVMSMLLEGNDVSHDTADTNYA